MINNFKIRLMIHKLNNKFFGFGKLVGFNLPKFFKKKLNKN